MSLAEQIYLICVSIFNLFSTVLKRIFLSEKSDMFDIVSLQHIKCNYFVARLCSCLSSIDEIQKDV